jgi:hypothetical protein
MPRVHGMQSMLKKLLDDNQQDIDFRESISSPTRRFNDYGQWVCGDFPL